MHLSPGLLRLARVLCTGVMASTMTVLLCATTSGCRARREAPSDATPPDTAPSVVVPPAGSEPELDILYLPDGGDRAAPDVGRPRLHEQAHPASRCPADMVDIAGKFCIDRYEAVLEDARGRRVSPYYHPTRTQTKASYEQWRQERHQSETAEGRALPVPNPPPWQLTEAFEPRAVSLPGEIPQGYMSGRAASEACHNAGKRLCTQEEWVTACRGEADTPFPYGTEYEPGRCNVFRTTHPAAVLHGNPAIHHLDPRLNLVAEQGRPLLRPTGTTPGCSSRWGDDAVYDMVGNLAEWVADEDGLFLGGFYARDARNGCERSVSAHAYTYFDYSLGLRCCQ